MPLGTYACSFVPAFAGADAWKAWAPPRAKAMITEVFIAAETLESLLKEANLSFATIHPLQWVLHAATRGWVGRRVEAKIGLAVRH